MTPLPPDLEALMPEPSGYLLDWPAIGGGVRQLFSPTRVAGDAIACKVQTMFSEDQVRAVMLAVTERAAKVVESGAPPRKLEGGRVEIGESARNAFAAAIRGAGGHPHEQ